MKLVNRFKFGYLKKRPGRKASRYEFNNPEQRNIHARADAMQGYKVRAYKRKQNML